jgi:hypothetical protein
MAEKILWKTSIKLADWCYTLFSHLIDWPADIWLALFIKTVGNCRQPFVSTNAFQVT